MKFFPFLLFNLFLIFSCKPARILSSSTYSKENEILFKKVLVGDWRYSYEEDSLDIRTYRKSDYKFPPSRGRVGMRFYENNSFEQLDIAPTDGLIPIKGSWSFNNKGLIVIKLSYKVTKTYKIDIKNLNKNRLDIKIVDW